MNKIMKELIWKNLIFSQKIVKSNRGEFELAIPKD